MSGTTASKAVTRDNITTPQVLGSSHADRFRIMDTILDRTSSTLSNAPYIVHCAGPNYRVGGHHKYNWQSDTTFVVDEEYLQHLSFVYRDPVTSCFLLRSEYEEQARRVKLGGGASSGTVTPLASQGAKKKISLSAYKNKTKVNGQGTTPAGQEQLCSRKESGAAVQHMVAPKEGPPPGQEVLGHSKDEESVEHEPLVESSVPGKPKVECIPNARQQGQKRPLKDALEHNGSRSPSSPHPAKKPRLTGPFPSKDSVPHTEAISLAMQPVRNVDSENSWVGTVEQVMITTEQSSTTSVRADLPPWLPHVSRRSETSLLPEQILPRLTLDSPDTSSSPESSRLSTTASITSVSSCGPQSKFQSSQSENGRGTNSEQQKPSAKPDIFKKEKVLASDTLVQGTAATSDSPKINPAHSTARHEHPHPGSSAQDPKLTDHLRGQVGLKATKPTGRPHEQNESSIPSPRLTKIVRKVNGGSSSFFETLKSLGTPVSPQIVPSQQVKLEVGSKIVRLKYGRNRKKDIERLLKMKPISKQENRQASEIPSKPSQQDATQTSDNAHVHNKAQVDTAATPESLKDDAAKSHGTEKVQSAFSSSARVEKRSRREDADDLHQPSAKRPRLADKTLPRSPRTPFVPAARSPALLTPSTSRARQTLTPRNDARPQAIAGAPPLPPVSTPQGSVGTPNVPESAESCGQSSQGPLDGTRIDKSLKAWKDELRSLSDLGTAMKRKLQADANSVGQQRTDQDWHQSKIKAVQGVESVLCFMQAFIAGEQYQSRMEIANNWHSIPPYAQDVSRKCRPFPHLHAISLLLCAVCCSRIVGSYANIKIDVTTSLETQSDILKKIQINTMAMQHHAVESDRLLPRGLLEKEYPLTHTESQKLPLVAITSPMVAVRMGSKFLAEWSAQQELEWTQQLEEGLCSQF